MDSDGKVDDKTEYTEQEVKKVVLGQDNGKDTGKEDPNVLFNATNTDQAKLIADEYVNTEG